MEPQLANSLVAIAQIVTAAVVLGGVGWGFFNYHQSKRREALKWTSELHQRFFLGPDLHPGKILLDFRYEQKAAWLLALAISEGPSALTEDELESNIYIDQVLNYLEHLLYLEREKQINPQDREAYFGYWFNLVRRPDRGELRRYFRHFGYDELHRFSGSQHDDFLVTSTVSGLSAPDMIEFEDQGLAVRIGPCTSKEPAHVLATAGLAEQANTVDTVLYRLSSEKALSKLDQALGYDPHNPSTSDLVRACTRVTQGASHGPDVDAWAYVAKKLPPN